MARDAMGLAVKTARTADELGRFTQDPGVGEILIQSAIDGLPTIRLQPGQSLRGTSASSALSFAPGVDGVRLTADNGIHDLDLRASVDRRVIFNEGAIDAWGLLELRDLQVVGQVQLLACDRVRRGHVEVARLHIAAADATGRADRPQDYGVGVLQGAFTLWNQQTESTCEISANLIGVSAGSWSNPVLGSGIFVSGGGVGGGRLQVRRLETGEVFSNGRIAAGTPDLISGGVFTLHGAVVDQVDNAGAVTTFGPNDMALDNWGTVDRWNAREKITTFGPSAIGFVNFGRLGQLEVDAPIETFGAGARGFNVYTGCVVRAAFDRIVTHGDGAVGIQIAQPVSVLEVRRGIETFGGIGPSLVKGQMQTLSAIALSIKPGGAVKRVRIEGGLSTHGDGVAVLEQLGLIESLQVDGGFASRAGDPPILERPSIETDA